MADCTETRTEWGVRYQDGPGIRVEICPDQNTAVAKREWLHRTRHCDAEVVSRVVLTSFWHAA